MMVHKYQSMGVFVMSESSIPLRLGAHASADLDTLGPLSSLVGTWFGNQGANLIAVPQGDKGFTLLTRPTTEVIVISPLPGTSVPNRGGPAGIQQIHGLHYHQTVWDSQTREVLHFENGMWLLVKNPKDPADKGQVARLTSVPHGDSFLAMGQWFDAVTPEFKVESALPEAGTPPLGYTDPYMNQKVVPPQDPNQLLKQAIAGQKITKTLVFDVSTATQGGITNIPFINQNAATSKVAATFWVETVQTAAGQTFQQLQYTQQVDISFLPKFNAPGKILWPHVSLNTLVKQ